MEDVLPPCPLFELFMPFIGGLCCKVACEDCLAGNWPVPVIAGVATGSLGFCWFVMLAW